jgi:hypothetical protein
MRIRTGLVRMPQLPVRGYSHHRADSQIRMRVQGMHHNNNNNNNNITCFIQRR